MENRDTKVIAPDGKRSKTRTYLIRRKEKFGPTMTTKQRKGGDSELSQSTPVEGTFFPMDYKRIKWTRGNDVQSTGLPV